ILYRLRARARRAVGDEAGARADVVRATPSVRPMLAHLDELLAERQFEAARAYFEDWIGARQKPPRQPFREVARRFAEAGDRDGALAVLEAALRQFPRFVLGRLDMARLHHAAGD